MRPNDLSPSFSSAREPIWSEETCGPSKRYWKNQSMSSKKRPASCCVDETSLSSQVPRKRQTFRRSECDRGPSHRSLSEIEEDLLQLGEGHSQFRDREDIERYSGDAAEDNSGLQPLRHERSLRHTTRSRRRIHQQ